MRNIFNIRFKHGSYVMMMSGIMTVIVLRNVLKLSIPIGLFLLLGCVFCLVCDREELVSYICSMGAFSAFFQYRYMIFIGVVFLLIKERKYSMARFSPIILIMVWELVHFFYIGIGIADFFREFAILVALGIVLIQRPIDYEDGLPIRSLAISTVFSCLIALVLNINEWGYSFFSGKRLGSSNGLIYELSESYNGIMNPNIASLLCLLSICGLVTIIKKGNGRKTDVCIILILIFFIILYQSKTAFVCLVIVGGSYLFVNNKQWFCSFSKWVCMSIPIIIGGIVFFKNSLIGFMERFTVSDISTGRFSLIYFYHRFIISDWKHFLFGVGLNNYNGRILKMYDISTLAKYKVVTSVKSKNVLVVAHNSIQEIITTWGIVGIGLTVWLLITIIKHSNNKKDFSNYLTFIILMIFTFIGQFFSSSIVILALLFSMICLEYGGTRFHLKENENSDSDI